MAENTPTYQISFGSDIKRDGVYLELARIESDGAYAIIEVFRSDSDGKITFTTFPAESEAIPPDLVARLVERIKTDLLERPLEANSQLCEQPGTSLTL